MAIDINIPSQVKTYANLAAFPATGTLKTIFIAEDTNKTYRWTGSVYVEVSAAGATGITIGTTAITSGTVGRVLFEGTGNVVQESANLFWDNTNGRLGIGTATPAVSLDARNGFNLYTPTTLHYLEATSASSTDGTLNFRRVGGQNGFCRFNLASGGSSFLYDGVTGETRIQSSDYITLFTFNTFERLRIFKTTGNVAIGTTTDAGFKLDVNGTARVQGNLQITSLTNTNNVPVFSASGSGVTITNGVGGGFFRYLGFTASTFSFYIFGSGNVGINSSGSDIASAQLFIDSTTKGFLPPRMTTTQKNAIATPAEGLQVWDTTLKLMFVYNGTTWISL